MQSGGGSSSNSDFEEKHSANSNANAEEKEAKSTPKSKAPPALRSYKEESESLASSIKPLEDFAAKLGIDFGSKIGGTGPVDFTASKFEGFTKELSTLIQTNLSNELANEKPKDEKDNPIKDANGKDITIKDALDSFSQHVADHLKILHKDMQASSAPGLDGAQNAIQAELQKLAAHNVDAAHQASYQTLQSEIKKKFEQKAFETLCASQAQYLKSKIDDKDFSHNVKGALLAEDVRNKGLHTEYTLAGTKKDQPFASLPGVSESNVGALSHKTFQPGLMYDSPSGSRLYLMQDEKDKNKVTVRAVREEAGLWTNLKTGKTEDRLYREAKMEEMGFLLQQGYTEMTMGDLSSHFTGIAQKNNGWLDAALNMTYDVFLEKTMPTDLSKLKNKYIVTTEGGHKLHYIDANGASHTLGASSKEVEGVFRKTNFSRHLDTTKTADGRQKLYMVDDHMDKFEMLILAHNRKDKNSNDLSPNNLDPSSPWLMKGSDGKPSGLPNNQAVLRASGECLAILHNLRLRGKISEKEFKKEEAKLNKINERVNFRTEYQEKNAATPNKPTAVATTAPAVISGSIQPSAPSLPSADQQAAIISSANPSAPELSSNEAASGIISGSNVAQPKDESQSGEEVELTSRNAAIETTKKGDEAEESKVESQLSESDDEEGDDQKKTHDNEGEEIHVTSRGPGGRSS